MIFDYHIRWIKASLSFLLLLINANCYSCMGQVITCTVYTQWIWIFTPRTFQRIKRLMKHPNHIFGKMHFLLIEKMNFVIKENDKFHRFHIQTIYRRSWIYSVIWYATANLATWCITVPFVQKCIGAFFFPLGTT